MATTRFLTGTAQDGTRYDFVEETRDPTGAVNGAMAIQNGKVYRLTRGDGDHLTKLADNEYRIVRTGVTIRV